MPGPFPDEPKDIKKPTEYGGDPGWMQPIEKGHTPTPSERLIMVNRTSGMDSVDPVTEIEQPVED